jgi:hypothetical protein
MAHFAKLDKNNIVIQVDVVNDLDIKDENGVEQEQVGINFLHSFYGNTNDVWKQTSYNTQKGVHLLGKTPFRKNYAGIEYTYDSVRDAFIPPQPYPSWPLNENTCTYDPPIPLPSLELLNDNERFVWDESVLNWKKETF